MNERRTCPKCGGTLFREETVGDDNYDSYSRTYEQCEACGLWYDDWDDYWFSTENGPNSERTIFEPGATDSTGHGARGGDE